MVLAKSLTESRVIPYNNNRLVPPRNGDPEVNAKLMEAGYDVIGSTPEEHDAETRRLVAFWIDLATKVKISAD